MVYCPVGLSLYDNLGRGARDETLDTLLDLDGQILVLDGKGEYWVKFSVRRIRATPEES